MKSNPETLKRHMYGFGKSLKKKKNSHLIPILGVSRSRRKYKHSGKGNAPYGRRVKDSALKSQMEVGEDSRSMREEVMLPMIMIQTNLVVQFLQAERK